jgi:Lar family restriction alleviation protein
MTKLKGCPFCGGKATVKDESDDRRFSPYTIECLKLTCPADFAWFKSPEEAIAAWNNRAVYLCNWLDQHHQDTIKAAVKAIENIGAHAVKIPHDQVTRLGECVHRRPIKDSCDWCTAYALSPHLKALKGLIDD